MAEEWWVKYDNIHKKTVAGHLTGKDNILGGAHDTQEIINMQHCTPKKKYDHRDSPAPKDGDSDADNDGKR